MLQTDLSLLFFLAAMDDWKTNNNFIQRLDFSSCGEDNGLEENRSMQEQLEGPGLVTPQKNWESQSWRINCPIPVTPQRQLADLSRTLPKTWASPASESKEPLRGNVADYPATPLHYVTWQKLQLCDTPHTPKVNNTQPSDTFLKFYGHSCLLFVA